MSFVSLPEAGSVSLKNASVPGWLFGATDPLVRKDLHVSSGKLVSAPASGNFELDLKGRIVFPCFVDMHTHLDKGHIWPRTPNPDGSFDGALGAVRSDREGRWDALDLRPRMEFSLRCAYAHGTRAIRTHLDYFDRRGEAEVSWHVFSELRESWSGRIDLQASVLAGYDLAADAADLAACADMVAEHRGVLGAVTYPDANTKDWVLDYFKAASERGLALDFHVDETLDPEVNTLKSIAEAALETGFTRPVTVGHLCSLSTMPEAEAGTTLDLVAKAGLNVVSLPMCNLYLQDRSPERTARTPRYRGITLVHEMRARGIPVSFASDNTRDPFYAYGDMDMLEVLREATRIGHLDHSAPDWSRTVLETPARACEFSPPSLAPGAPADLVIFNARMWIELFARPQSDRIVLREGAAIDRTLPDYSELDELMEPKRTSKPQSTRSVPKGSMSIQSPPP